MKSRIISSLVTLLLVLVLTGTAGATTISIFTDLSSWQASVGVYGTETFNDGTVDYGITVTTGNGQIVANKWSDRVIPNTSTTTWTFPQPLDAWAADFWDLAGPGGPGTSIQIYLDGVAVPGEIPSSTQGTFWGVTSDVPFSEVLVTAGTTAGWAESYEMDNMSFVIAETPDPAIPAPGALVLGGIGMSLVTWMRRRRTV